MDKPYGSGKYVVVFLLRGNIKKYHKNLADKIANEYKMKSVSKTIDAHITFKEFRTLLSKSNIGDIENLLKEFCKNHRKVSLRLKGISSFGRRIIFIDVVPSDAMKKIYSDFTNEMDKLSWMKWNEFEKEKIHFHTTLVEGKENLEDFDNIFTFAKKESPDLDLEMDNISILTKPKNKWILYRSFKLLKA